MIFSWDDWNSEHVKKHGCQRADAEFVVRNAADPFPREMGDDKYLVWGQSEAGLYLQVIFVLHPPEEIEFVSLSYLEWSAFIDSGETVAVYICHAMPMTERQIKRYRKLRKQS